MFKGTLSFLVLFYEQYYNLHAWAPDTTDTDKNVKKN